MTSINKQKQEIENCIIYEEVFLIIGSIFSCLEFHSSAYKIYESMLFLKSNIQYILRQKSVPFLFRVPF